jgi:hypothetical protein
MKLRLLILSLLAGSVLAEAPDPQANDKRVCLQEWKKTKANLDSLLKRKLAMNANRIAEQCAPFWTTPDQKAMAERIKLAMEGRERDMRKTQGVRLGMSAEEVLQSTWGKPESVNRTTTSRGVREQWVYPGRHNYLYFEDGVLTSIQN